MKRLLTLIGAGICLLNTAFAQTDTAGITEKTLENGVRVLLKPERETPIVAVSAMIQIPPPRTELEAATSEIVARGMFYGSLSLSAKSMLRSIEQTGGRWEIIETEQTLGVVAVLPAPQLSEALYFLSDALKNAEFPQTALTQARQEILDERKDRDKEPFAALSRVITRSFAPFSDPDEFALKRITPEQAAAYYQTYVSPQKLVVGIVGKFNAEQALGTVTNLFGNMKTRSALPKQFASNTEKRDPSANYTPRLPAGRSAYALVATSTPDVTNPDYPAFLVMETILGGGHSSRLFQRIRTEKGIGYTVGTDFDETRSQPLIAYLQWDSKREFTAKTDRLTPLQLLNAQVDTLVIEPPTEAELERARNVAIGKHALRHERARDRVFALVWYEALGLGWQFDTAIVQKISAVTQADVLRVAKLYLPKRVTLLAVPK